MKFEDFERELMSIDNADRDQVERVHRELSGPIAGALAIATLPMLRDDALHPSSFRVGLAETHARAVASAIVSGGDPGEDERLLSALVDLIRSSVIAGRAAR